MQENRLRYRISNRVRFRSWTKSLVAVPENLRDLLVEHTWEPCETRIWNSVQLIVMNDVLSRINEGAMSNDANTRYRMGLVQERADERTIDAGVDGGVRMQLVTLVRNDIGEQAYDILEIPWFRAWSTINS